MVYFERASDKYVILAPAEIGSGMQYARMVYETKYRHGWSWCEADTLGAIDTLQKRLSQQDIQEAEKRVQVNSFVRDQIYRETGSNLRSRMVSDATSPWERDFIKAYLSLREDKRDRYRDSLLHHNYYIWSRENDDGSKVEDRLPMLEGQFERTGA